MGWSSSEGHALRSAPDGCMKAAGKSLKTDGVLSWRQPPHPTFLRVLIFLSVQPSVLGGNNILIESPRALMAFRLLLFPKLSGENETLDKDRKLHPPLHPSQKEKPSLRTFIPSPLHFINLEIQISELTSREGMEGGV